MKMGCIVKVYPQDVDTLFLHHFIRNGPSNANYINNV